MKLNLALTSDACPCRKSRPRERFAMRKPLEKAHTKALVGFAGAHMVHVSATMQVGPAAHSLNVAIGSTGSAPKRWRMVPAIRIFAPETAVTGPNFNGMGKSLPLLMTGRCLRRLKQFGRVDERRGGLGNLAMLVGLVMAKNDQSGHVHPTGSSPPNPVIPGSKSGIALLTSD